MATSLTDWTIRPDPEVNLTVKSFDGLQVCSDGSHSTCMSMFAIQRSMEARKHAEDLEYGMQKEYRNDRAWLTLNLEADLRSVFHWNTKQVLCCGNAQAMAIARS